MPASVQANRKSASETSQQGCRAAPHLPNAPHLCVCAQAIQAWQDILTYCSDFKMLEHKACLEAVGVSPSFHPEITVCSRLCP